MGDYQVLKQAQPVEMSPQWKRIEEFPTLTTIVVTGYQALEIGDAFWSLGRQWDNFIRPRRIFAQKEEKGLRVFGGVDPTDGDDAATS